MNLLIIMDDINAIKPQKDTTLAMLRAGQELGYTLYICDTTDISYHYHKKVFALLSKIAVHESDEKYYTLISNSEQDLSTMDTIIMRKDPPFDMNYIYATYLLEIVMQNGVRVVNNPRSLRDFNEKVILSRFAHLSAPTLISSSLKVITKFITQYDSIILKPLDAMGGSDIFKKQGTDDITSEVRYLTKEYTTPIMVQKFIPEIIKGDKRIILIKGVSVGYALARIPAKGSFKGNLAQGASYEVRELTKQDIYICNELKDFLIQNELDFVGIDVIGEYLTEINITSPTGVREIDNTKKTHIALDFIKAIM